MLQEKKCSRNLAGSEDYEHWNDAEAEDELRGPDSGSAFVSSGLVAVPSAPSGGQSCTAPLAFSVRAHFAVQPSR